MSTSYVGGLNFTWPVKSDLNWDGVADTALTIVSAHGHTGAGDGKQLVASAFANDSITGAKIRLANLESLRARNAANSADLDLLQLDAGNILEFERVARFSSSDTLSASGALSLTTNLTILNGTSLAMTLANGAEGQIKWIVNINSTAATVTPGTTAGPNEVKLLQYGAVMYIYLSGEWRFVKGNPQGTTTNDNATAGDVGEIIGPISRLRSNATALTTNTTLNVCTTASITLTPGDWDIRGVVGFTPAALASITVLQASVSKTTATLSATDTIAVPTASECRAIRSNAASIPGSGNDISLEIPTFRASVAGNTSIFLVAQATFTAAALTAYGSLDARRAR